MDCVGNGYTNIATPSWLMFLRSGLNFGDLKARATAVFLVIGMGLFGVVKSSSSLLFGVLFFCIGVLMMYFGSIP